MNKDKSIVLIDLDVILDTRTGVLFELNPEEAVNILNKGWRNRKSDTMDMFSDIITTEAYLEAYENRSKYTLSISRPSNILKLIAPELYKMVLMTTKSNSKSSDFCLVVNTYPYNLTDYESKAIQMSISEQIGPDVPIRIANHLPESCTLGNLDMRGYTDYITYDIQGWISREFSHITQPDEFLALPHIVIRGPALAITDDAHQNVINENTILSEKDDPWEFIKVTFAPFVGIEWLDIGSVSLID